MSSNTVRWSEEQLAEFERRRREMRAKGTVRTHRIKDDEDPEFRQDGKPRRRSGPSELELLFSKQLLDAKFSPPRREFKFMDDRDWRLDYAWPDRKIAVEVQGMVHRIKTRFLADVEKMAMAQIHGWRVLLVAGQDVRSGRALSWLVSIWGNYECDHIWGKNGVCGRCGGVA